MIIVAVSVTTVVLVSLVLVVIYCYRIKVRRGNIIQEILQLIGLPILSARLLNNHVVTSTNIPYQESGESLNSRSELDHKTKFQISGEFLSNQSVHY